MPPQRPYQIPLSRPLSVIAVLLGSMVVIAVIARHGPAAGMTPPATPVRSADLLMLDRLDGSVSVTEAGTGRVVTTLEPKTNAFVRVLLSGLVQERRREGEGSHAIPFRLTRWSAGRLTIDDTATGHLIELEASGHTNEESFARMLDAITHSLTIESGPFLQKKDKKLLSLRIWNQQTRPAPDATEQSLLLLFLEKKAFLAFLG